MTEDARRAGRAAVVDVTGQPPWRPARRCSATAASLPPRVRAEVQRILDRAARRLLAEQVDADALGAATGCDGGALDGRPDEGTALVQRQPFPVGAGVDGDGRARAA